MDAIGVNRISVPEASFLGVEEGVPRCRRPRSSVPLIRHLGEEKKRGTLSTENQPNIHSLTERDAQSADCHLFSTLKNCAIIIGGGESAGKHKKMRVCCNFSYLPCV